MHRLFTSKLSRPAKALRLTTSWLLLAGLSSTSFGQTTYYVAASGNDGNSGRSSDAPYKTIDKVNSLSLQPGDQVLFRRGDTFRGSLKIRQSGVANRPIVVDAFGEGNKPLLAGSIQLSNWNNIGNNTWQASCSSCGNDVTGVYRNGEVLPLGRYPNLSDTERGYLNIQSHSGKTQLTSRQSLPGNWTGGEVVIRPVQWVLDRATITGQSGNTLSMADNGTKYQPNDGWGFFIQKHPGTLDQPGEWYYNPSDKTIRLFDNQSNPNNQQITVTTFSEAVNLTNVSYVTVRNLQIAETLTTGIAVNNGSNLVLSGNDLKKLGADAITAVGSGNTLLIENNLIQDVNNNGVYVGPYQNVTIRGNTLQRIAMVPGRGGSGDGSYTGLQSVATANVLIESNVLDYIGYNGISVFSNSTIQKNVVSNFCLTKSDGSGVYSWNGDYGNPGGNRIISNVIFNGLGAPEGTVNDFYAGANGIFLDDCSKNAEIVNNTTFNCKSKGLLLRGTSNVVVRGNTSYNNGEEQIRLGYNEPCAFRNNTLQDNIFVSRTPNQLVADYESYANDLNQYGPFDNNRYISPFQDAFKIQAVWNPGSGLTGKVLTLAEWQAQWNQDRNSTGSPFTYKQEVVSQTGANRLNNSFSDGTNGWSVWSPNGNGRVDWDNSNRLDGGSMRLWFASASNQRNSYSLAIQTVGSVRKGQAYQLLFDGIASSATKRVQVYLRQRVGSYQDLSPRKDYVLNTSRQGYDITFTATADESDAILVVQTDEDGQSAWLDNIRLNEVSLSPVNPDDYIKLVYNTTAQTKVESLNGAYRDAKNNSYNGQVTVEPYASVILFKEVNNTPTPPPAVTLRDPENPASTTNGLDYQYYEGNWSALPNFAALTPVKTGTAGQVDLSPRSRDQNYGLRFTGYINAPADGSYTFYTTSDDGTKLYIGNTEVVSNDGVHGDQERSGSIGLKAGKHAITVVYFQGVNGQSLSASYSGPSLNKQVIPASAFFRVPTTTPTPTPSGSGVYLSDLSWTSVTNGYGPVEKDKSNGEANAGDGRTITLNGQTYTKGLGVHAASSISYNLGGQYTQFITDMGLDDEIASVGCGTIEFQVFLDGNKVYSSGIVNAATATKSLVLDVSGKQTLTLVVTDGGDGAACDHGDWAGARLIPTGGATTTPVAGNGSGTGLRGDYYPNTTLSGSAALTRRDDTVNFEWSDSSPAAGRVGTDNFSVRWTGQVEAPVTGSYTFYATTDDGVRLWVNGTQLIDQWVPQGPTLVAGKVLNLTAGQRYDIRMEYFEYGGGATAKLLWLYPGQGQQPIPQVRLYPASMGSGRQAVAEASRATVLVYPVPAQETVWIRYDAPTAGTATVQLVSLAGQAVLQTEQAVTAGENTIRLNVRSLNRGSYVLMLTQGNQRQTQKLILTE
ncbi:putative secreted protein (Por secretion system target) [Spirosoma oryzae]|uniref:Putative secreted protein (Por secretion system target) n=1 Tax=Spirosoma oryzae TaxID=1469603 RepID=A0A2T0T3B4_9BACT|nr:NPCBM/NEW2 domain-containing protein [Spirosoma oryzae]PRY40123.1 putative secreted protein (Por secretion system target) [Spirosoma oryzae]